MKRAAAMFAVFAVAAAGLGAMVARATPIALMEPEMVARATPLAIGVGVHFGIGGAYGYRPAAAAAALTALGVGRYRDDLVWSEFNPQGDASSGAVPAKLKAFAAAAGHTRPLLILGHPHPRVANGALPIDAAARDAFARYVADAVGATPAADYEIWNEWNNEPVSGRPPLRGPGLEDDPRSAAAYARLARAGTDAAHDRRPKAHVLVGADGSDPDWSWIAAVVRHGGAVGADGVSVHVYNHCEAARRRTGDRAIEQMEALRAVQRRDGWSATPIWVSELGWPTPAGPAACGVSRTVQADNLAQWLLWAAATPWVHGAYLYELKDQGTNAAEIEDNFGLFDYDYAPKPAACTVREVTAIVRSGRRWGVTRPRDGVTLIRVDGGDGPRLIAWSQVDAIVRTHGAAVAFRPLCGRGEQRVAVPIGPRPTVIDLRGLVGGVAALSLS